MESYGMNTQEGGSMCQVLTEHAQTLGTTHRGGAREGWSARCFTQNTRDEVRFVNGDDAIVGAIAAESGMKQQNYVLWRNDE